MLKLDLIRLTFLVYCKFAVIDTNKRKRHTEVSIK